MLYFVYGMYIACIYVLRPMIRIEGFIVAFCISLIFRYTGVQVYYINRTLAIWIGQTKWQASEAHSTDRQANGNPRLLCCQFRMQRHWLLSGTQN